VALAVRVTCADIPWAQPWHLLTRVIGELFTNRFRKLPSKVEVHEWAIMEDFSNSVASDGIREDLLRAIHGRGAFRSFKEALRRHRIEPVWFQFRAEALRQIALDWCEANNVAWE
jgi:hypothetical protein